MGGFPTTELSAGRGWLAVNAASSIVRIDKQLGHPLQITEAGRTWEQQKKHWDAYQANGYPIALHPDTPSIHQLGNAIDTDEQNLSVLNLNGWFQTVYRDGVLIEPWHFEYFSGKDKFAGKTPATEDRLEDDMVIFFEDKDGKRGRAVALGSKWVPLTNSQEIKLFSSIADRKCYLTTGEFDAYKNVWGRGQRLESFSDTQLEQLEEQSAKALDGVELTTKLSRE